MSVGSLGMLWLPPWCLHNLSFAPGLGLPPSLDWDPAGLRMPTRLGSQPFFCRPWRRGNGQESLQIKAGFQALQAAQAGPEKPSHFSLRGRFLGSGEAWQQSSGVFP